MSVDRSLRNVQNFTDFPGSFSHGGPRQYLLFNYGDTAFNLEPANASNLMHCHRNRPDITESLVLTDFVAKVGGFLPSGWI